MVLDIIVHDIILFTLLLYLLHFQILTLFLNISSCIGASLSHLFRFFFILFSNPFSRPRSLTQISSGLLQTALIWLCHTLQSCPLFPSETSQNNYNDVQLSLNDDAPHGHLPTYLPTYQHTYITTKTFPAFGPSVCPVLKQHAPEIQPFFILSFTFMLSSVS